MVASKRLRIAAGLQLASAAVGSASAIRILSAGRAGLPPLEGAEGMGGPPFWAGLMFFALAVASLFSAFGLVRGERWGRIVAVCTAAVNAVFAGGDLLGAIMLGSALMGLAFGASVLGHLLIVALVLRREAATGPLAATAR